MEIKYAVEMAHRIALSKGFWDSDKGVPEVLCNFHEEVSEALQAFKHNNPTGFNEEMADIVIRVFDACGKWNIDLEKEIKIKMETNKMRLCLHGKERNTSKCEIIL